MVHEKRRENDGVGRYEFSDRGGNSSTEEVAAATKEISANNKMMHEKSASVRDEGQTTDTFPLLFRRGRKLCPQRH